jgi:hypothetical protein
MRNPFRHRVQELEHSEDMGIRIFSNQNIPDTAEENWGMEDIGELPWLDEVHNTMKGERVFLMGTGPSLIDQLPLLGRLNDEYTITCNRMNKWKERPFSPWIHAITEPNPLVAWGAGVGSAYEVPDAKNYVACCWSRVTAKGWHWLPKAPDDVQVRWQGTFGMGDFLPPIPTAWASPITIAQLALWMGFDELYFLGNDLTQMGQAWDRNKGTTKFPRNIRSIMECGDRVNRDVWRNGRKMYDCTPGGRLNVEGAVEYVPLEEVLAR